MSKGKGKSSSKKKEKFKGRHPEGRKEWSRRKRKAGFKKGAVETDYVRKILREKGI